MEKQNIRFVLNKSNLSDNPSHYDFRDVRHGDINAKVLCDVSKNIRKYIGQKEQKVFNRMVFDLPTLKASFFIEFTVTLQLIGIEDGWWWDKEKVFNHYDPEILKMPICEETERIKVGFKKLMNLGGFLSYN